MTWCGLTGVEWCEVHYTSSYSSCSSSYSSAHSFISASSIHIHACAALCLAHSVKFNLQTVTENNLTQTINIFPLYIFCFDISVEYTLLLLGGCNLNEFIVSLLERPTTHYSISVSKRKWPKWEECEILFLNGPTTSFPKGAPRCG